METKYENILKSIKRGKRRSLILSLGLSMFLVFTAAVSTYAWYQATASASISASPSSAEINVAAPEGAKFYYFTGNGTPGSDYTGYSRSDSAIGKAPRNNIVYNAETPPVNVAFDYAADTYYFAEITGESNITVDNCFDLSKIRPGSYYSFCVKYSGSSVGLNITLSTSACVTGASTSPKRQIGGVNLSLAFGLNGAVSGACDKDYADDFIQQAFEVSDGTSNDKIKPSACPASQEFTFTSGLNTTASNAHYIFFSIFMGSQNKADALLYSSKSGSGASETITYTKNSSGNYSAYDGLSMTLTRVEVTMS